MTERVVSERKPTQRLIRRLPLLFWLTLVWVMLWGRIDVGTVLFGLVVAMLVTTVFPLPPITTNIFIRPLRIIELAVYLAWDLVVSTFKVAWQAVWHGHNTKAAIVAVPLSTDSDHIIAITSNAVSLAPGTFVMQIDRARLICYVYQLGMRVEDAESVRRHVLALEARVVRAVGSVADIDALQAGRGH